MVNIWELIQNVSKYFESTEQKPVVFHKRLNPPSETPKPRPVGTPFSASSQVGHSKAEKSVGQLEREKEIADLRYRISRHEQQKRDEGRSDYDDDLIRIDRKHLHYLTTPPEVRKAEAQKALDSLRRESIRFDGARYEAMKALGREIDSAEKELARPKWEVEARSKVGDYLFEDIRYKVESAYAQPGFAPSVRLFHQPNFLEIMQRPQWEIEARSKIGDHIFEEICLTVELTRRSHYASQPVTQSAVLPGFSPARGGLHRPSILEIVQRANRPDPTAVHFDPCSDHMGQIDPLAPHWNLSGEHPVEVNPRKPGPKISNLG